MHMTKSKDTCGMEKVLASMERWGEEREGVRINGDYGRGSKDIIEEINK